MTLSQLFNNADSRELALWIALYRQEADSQRLQEMAARAESARRRRR